jgi:trimethylamine--corrinoid protein Co-methyltransferase
MHVAKHGVGRRDPAGGRIGQLLAAYEPPPLDPAIAEEIAAFVARRKEEGGVPDQ